MTTLALQRRLGHLRTSDVRGIVQLATQATAGVTRIIEGVHRSVWETMGVAGGTELGQTQGVSGLVYKSVHDIAHQLGKGFDTGLAGLKPPVEPIDDPGPDTPRREAVLSALNGVLGDRLAGDDNPLAIPMTLRHRGETLNRRSAAPGTEAGGKVLLLVHGLCMSDLRSQAQYKQYAFDHGEALASTLGYTPVYLRYNSGLRVSENGREMSSQLEKLVTRWPTPLEEVSIVAHSMGGLVARSAFHFAGQAAFRWPDYLRSIVFLGTPHHGAPLERIGNWVDRVLASTPYTGPFVRLGRVRSAGIKDLRHGYLLDEDRQGHDRHDPNPESRQVMPLPDGVACHTVAATRASRRSVLANHLIGDGLVPLHSALGTHEDASRNLKFADASQWIVYRTSHGGLLHSPEVTRKMVDWLTPAQV